MASYPRSLYPMQHTFVCVQDRKVARSTYTERARCPVCQEEMRMVWKAPAANDNKGWNDLRIGFLKAEAGHMTPDQFRARFVLSTLPEEQRRKTTKTAPCRPYW